MGDDKAEETMVLRSLVEIVRFFASKAFKDDFALVSFGAINETKEGDVEMMVEPECHRLMRTTELCWRYDGRARLEDIVTSLNGTVTSSSASPIYPASETPLDPTIEMAVCSHHSQRWELFASDIYIC